MTKFCLLFLASILIAGARPAIAQLPPPAQVPAVEQPLSPGSKRIFTTIKIPNRPSPVPVIVHVTSQGSDDGDGSAEHPFRSLLRAKAAVRMLNQDHDVTVQIADGVYRLDTPLRFIPQDGGHNGFTV